MPGRVTEADIRRAAQKAGIPYSLFAAVITQESGGRTGAVSPAGARGPAQLMPGTARGLERKYGIKTSTPYGNLLGGAYYLAEQKKRFKTWRKALAAYNAGPGAVLEYGGVPPYEETQNYVRNILAKAKLGTTGKPATVPASTRGGVVLPSSQEPALSAPPSVQPLEMSMQEGLRDLVEGDYDPSRALGGLLEFQRAQTPTPAPVSRTHAPVRSQGPPQQTAKPSGAVKGGLTYAGQDLTHATDGLPGYPAVDLFADPGTPFRAPEPGRVIRLSGRGGTKGGYYGWSVYFKGDSGRIYYIQHLNKQRAKKGRYEQGAVLGTVSPWEGGAPHAHVGIKGKKK